MKRKCDPLATYFTVRWRSAPRVRAGPPRNKRVAFPEASSYFLREFPSLMKVRISLRLLIVALSCSCALAASARSVSELMTDLQTALQESGEVASSGDQPADAVPSLAQLETQLEKAIAQGGAGAPRLLATMRAATESKKIQELCAALAKQIPAERDAQETAFLEQVKAGVQQAGTAALQAKNKTELDPILQNLNELQVHQTAAFSDLGKRGIEQIAAAQQFVTDWQNYLVQKEKAPPAARALLQGMIDHCTYPIVPRAEIQARLEAVAATEAKPKPAVEAVTLETILADLKEPADLAPKLAQLRALSAPEMAKTALIAELESLAAFDEKRRADLDPPLNLLDGSTHFLPLRLKLTLLALPHSLGLPDDFKADADETVGHFLDRVMAEATSQQNWVLLSKAVAASQLLTQGASDPAGSSSRPTPLQSFLIGLNQEQAAQYALALGSYQEALKDTANLVPVNVVRERLEAMKKNHPKEFEEGMRQMGHTPMPVATGR